MIKGAEHLEHLMAALAGALEVESSRVVDLVVCGGAALNALGLVSRTTDDVDILALVVDEQAVLAEPLSEELVRAIERVARDHGLPKKWMNNGPTDLQRYGLPKGLLQRTHAVQFGPKLTVRFIDRVDQIHLKLYALVDQGPGKHVRDFTALDPTHDEVLLAGRWCTHQDPSEGFRMVLEQALEQLGFADVVNQLT